MGHMPQQGMSAYQPEQEMVSPPDLPTKRSKIPQVLGIMHLCIGGLSLLSSLPALLQGKTASSELEELMRHGVEGIGPDLIECLQALDGPLRIASGFDTLVCLMMILAGVGLLRYQAWGRLCTNIYVALSLLTKVFSAYVWCVMAADVYAMLVDAIPALAELGDVGGSVIRISIVISLVVMSSYAVVCLFLVNKKSVVKSLM